MPVGAIATKGALGEARTAGYRERRGMTDGGTRVPEVLSAAALPLNHWRRAAGGGPYPHSLLPWPVLALPAGDIIHVVPIS